MARTFTAQQLGIKEPTGGFQESGFYQGRQFKGGLLGEPGKTFEGETISTEVIAQTDPKNVSFIQSQIEADQIQPSPTIGLPATRTTTPVDGLQAGVDKARSTLEATLGAQQAEVNERLAKLREEEKQITGEIGALTTPFREKLEETERERLFINKNFEENQKLVDELDTLLTEGNELIRQQQEVTGLAAVRNPRIQRSMNDVAARAGVIEAVISARNGQIGQATNLIDRTIKAITADRNDQISYYETLLNLNNQKILSLDKESQRIAKDQLDLAKGDLERAQATQDYVKELMLDPATASLMGDAGVSLNDPVDVINQKMSRAQYAREVRDMSNEIALEGGQAVVDPSTVPAGQLITVTDSRGVKRHYKVPKGSSLANVESGSKIGTTSARIENAAKLDASFPDFVVTYANTLSLPDIYEAYARSPRGEQFGAPKENPREIALLFKVATGEMSAAEAERDLAR